MLYLILSIVFSAALVLLFKVFERKGVPLFQAIVCNYWTATICAVLFLPGTALSQPAAILKAEWLPLAFGLGCLFITVFTLTSNTTVKFGVSTASVASKLGLVFPVILAFTMYGETFSALKLVGILLAFVAVVLSSIKKKEHMAHHGKAAFLLPLLVFLGSGLCDSITQYANKRYLMNSDMEAFTLVLFMAAGIAGTVFLLYTILGKGARFSLLALRWGIVLGVVNYFSFLFLLKALATLPWGSSVVFPLNNLGMVAFSTLVGVMAFKERISLLNFVGLLFAAASIAIIVIANAYYS